MDLVGNPERFTGYAGHDARKIWESIYQQNCFSFLSSGSQSSKPQYPSSFPSFGHGGSSRSLNIMEQANNDALLQLANEEAVCLEKRVFYRVISGMHTSISVHLCHAYYAGGD